MSEDWIIRSDGPLRFEVVLEKLAELLPDMAIRPHSSSNWILVVDPDDVPGIWIAGSRADASAPGAHVTEVSAPGYGSIGPFPSPAAVLEQLVPALAAGAGGTAHRLSAAEVEGDSGASAHPGGAPRRRRSSDASDSPADSVIGRSAIVGLTHQVVTLSLWLVQQYQSAAEANRRLVVVTPTGTELTHAAADMLQQTGSLWAVDTGTEFFDGRTGARLDWENGEFVPSRTVADEFAPHPDDEWVMVIDGETTHPYDEQLRIGEFCADVYAAASVDLPMAAGSLEPGEVDFDSAALTAVAKAASPQDTRFVLRGRTSNGILDVQPQPIGIVERLQIIADAPVDPWSEDQRDAFVAAALRSGAQVAICGYRRSAPQRRRPSRLIPPVIPAVAVFVRSRYPTLTDHEALRLAGPTAALVTEPVPAVVVQFDANVQPETDQDHPVTVMDRLVTGLMEHDEHDQLRRAQS